MRPTILAYHAIGSCPRSEDHHNLFVTEEAFAKQMDFLARRRHVVALDAVIEERVPRGRPAVAITFDDGYRNVLKIAGPIMQRHGFRSTIFVPTDWVGRTNGWIEPTTCDLEIMEADELREAETLGIAVESHGHAHIDMGASGDDEVHSDIAASIERLEDVTGRRPRYLAYPYGHRSAGAERVAASAGLTAAFTIDEPGRGLFAYERVQVTPLDSMTTFALKTSGRYLSVRNSRVFTAAYGAAKPLVRKALQRGRT